MSFGSWLAFIQFALFFWSFFFMIKLLFAIVGVMRKIAIRFFIKFITKRTMIKTIIMWSMVCTATSSWSVILQSPFPNAIQFRLTDTSVFQKKSYSGHHFTWEFRLETANFANPVTFVQVFSIVKSNCEFQQARF